MGDIASLVGLIPSIISPKSLSKKFQKALPIMLDIAKEFDPQFTELRVQNLEEFLPRVTNLFADTQRSIFPITFDLQEKLAQQATEGIEAPLPVHLRDTFLDQFRAETGVNAGAPVGAFDISRNLAVLGEEYRNNFRNLGLSLLNRFPVNQPVVPPVRDLTGNFNLGEAANFVGQQQAARIGAAGNVISSAAPSFLASQQQDSGGFLGGGIGKLAGSILGSIF